MEVVEQMQSARLVTVNQAATMLGLRPGTIRAWYYQRRLSRVRVGKRAIRIPLLEVQRILREGITSTEKTPARANQHQPSKAQEVRARV